MNSQNLYSLSKADVKGRIPKLRHLDISENLLLENDIERLFDLKCKWEHLLSLNVKDTSLNSFNNLNSKMKSGCLLALQELSISTENSCSDTTNVVWPSLTDIQIHSRQNEDDEKQFAAFAEMFRYNLFVSIENVYLSRSLERSFYESNLEKRPSSCPQFWSNNSILGSWMNSATNYDWQQSESPEGSFLEKNLHEPSKGFQGLCIFYIDYEVYHISEVDHKLKTVYDTFDMTLDLTASPSPSVSPERSLHQWKVSTIQFSKSFGLL